MKTRPHGGTRASLTRFAFVSALGAVAMTATAHLAAPPRASTGAPQVRPVPASTPAPVPSAAATLVTGTDGIVRLDGVKLRSLDVGEFVDLSPLADAETERFEVVRRHSAGYGVYWWRLDSAEFEESQAVLVERRGFVSLWMQSPKFGEHFEWTFDSIGRGRSISTPRAIDLPDCGGTIAAPMGPPPESGAARLAGGGGDSECSGCGSLEADIAFFYTPQVRTQVETELLAAGGDPEDAPDVIAVRCAQDCANASVAMANSELPFGTRPVHVSEVDFAEEGEDFLGRFASRGDGEMDEIHQIRDDVGADVCTLITLATNGDEEINYCGVALLGDGDSPEWAFNNVVWSCTGGLTFAHEFGHNVGCCHAAGDGGGCDDLTPCQLWDPTWAGCCMPDPSGPGSVPEPSYNHGWRWVNELSVPACVRTVMAYAKTEGGSSLQVPYFSNPEVDYLATPIGSPEDDPDGKWADNARVIRENMPGTIGYRCEAAESATDDGRLSPTGLGATDFFGQSVATNGEVMAVGAPRHDVSGLNAGAVFIFTDPDEKDGEPDLGWVQTGKLTPTDLAAGDRFGESVALSQSLLAVGAPYSHRYVVDEVTEEILEDHPLAGAASVWSPGDDGRYCRLGESIQPDDLQDYDFFGTAVAVAGDLLAVGAPGRDVNGKVDAGAVWVYRQVGDVFELFEVLEGTEEGGRFGQSLAAAVQPGGYTVLLVGAPKEQTIHPGPDEPPLHYGRVYPYGYVPTGDTWVSTPGTPRLGPWIGGRFGASVAIRGEDVIVGAPFANAERGAARVFRVSGVDLALEDSIETGNVEGDHAGTAVAITDTFAAVSVPGHDVTIEVDGVEVVLDDLGMVAVYSRYPGEIAWEIRQVLRPADLRPGDRLGASASLAGNRLLAGAPEGEGDDDVPLSGVVYAVDVTEIIDCNENGIDDSVDIVTGGSIDHDGDGIPDECEVGLCEADINGDGVVDGVDLGLLLVVWGDCPDLEPGCTGDFDADGTVGGPDLGLFCASWGLKCEPPAP